jgi:hypothetical protein
MHSTGHHVFISDFAYRPRQVAGTHTRTHASPMTHPISIMRVCTAGYLGGLAKYLLVQPLDTMTTIYEVRTQRSSGGLLGAVQERVAAKGARSLFSGLKSTAVLALPYAIFFHSGQIVASHWSENFMAERERRAGVIGTQRQQQHRRAISDMVGSMAGSTIACCVGIPMEALKHRAQVLG